MAAAGWLEGSTDPVTRGTRSGRQSGIWVSPMTMPCAQVTAHDRQGGETTSEKERARAVGRELGFVAEPRDCSRVCVTMRTSPEREKDRERAKELRLLVNAATSRPYAAPIRRARSENPSRVPAGSRAIASRRDLLRSHGSPTYEPHDRDEDDRADRGDDDRADQTARLGTRQDQREEPAAD